MREKIGLILESLVSHEISKGEAIDMLLVQSAANSCADTVGALNASVSAIYFSDSSDYLNLHYEVVRRLVGADIELDRAFIGRLYDELNPE